MAESSPAADHELSLAAGVLAEFDAEVVAETAGRSDYRLAGFTIEPTAWSNTRTRNLQRLISNHQLSVLDVEVVWIPEGGAVNDDHRLIIDVAAEIGAANVLVVSSEADVGRAADALRQLCERAAPAPMRIALEFLMLTPIQTLDAALAVVARCDHPAAAVLVDTLHFQRGGHVPGDLTGIEPQLLPYVQLCDGNLSCDDNYRSYREDALDLRSAPGEGQLPLGDILARLPARCPLSLEVRSNIYRRDYPDPVERARAIRNRTLQFLTTSQR